MVFLRYDLRFYVQVVEAEEAVQKYPYSCDGVLLWVRLCSNYSVLRP